MNKPGIPKEFVPNPHTRGFEEVIKKEGAEDAAQDAYEVGIRGDVSIFDDNVFDADLLENETVKKVFEVNVAVQQIRSFCWFFILTLATFGVYLIWVFCCQSCRGKRIWTRRAKLAVTDLGRLMLWDQDYDGTEGCCPMLGACMAGMRTIDAHTKMYWFSMEDLSFIQHTYQRTSVCCGLCDPKNDACLRLFFGEYPDQDLVDANCPEDFTEGVIMKKLEAEGVDNLFYSFLRLPVEAANSTAQKLKAAIAGWGQTNVLEIRSPSKDLEHPAERPAFTDLLEIEKILLEAKKPVDAITSVRTNIPEDELSVTNENKSIVDLSTGCVNINPEDLAFLPGEEVVAAYPDYTRVSLMEILLSVLTLGLYYYFSVIPNHQKRGAIVLTRKRLFEISVKSRDGDYSPTKCDPNDDFEVCVNQWLLGHIGIGYIERVKFNVYAHIQTAWGGLIINCQAPDGLTFCDELCGNGAESYVDKMVSFLLNFTFCYCPQLLEKPHYALQADDYWLLANYKPDPIMKESAVFKLKSREKEQGCFKKICDPELPQQELVVTTHKLWGTARLRSEPLLPCYKQFHDVIFWIPLRDLTKYRIISDHFTRETFWNRMCACLPCVLAAFDAKLRIEVGALNFFPVHLMRANENCGALIGDDDIYTLRTILATVVGTSNRMKGITIGTPAAPEESKAPPETTDNGEVQPPPQQQMAPPAASYMIPPIFQSPQAHLHNPGMPAFYFVPMNQPRPY